MKRNGFTLIEVLSVVALLGILALVAGSSIFSVMENERNKLLEEQIANLGDSALSFAIQKRYFFDVCPEGFDPKNPTTSLKNKCYREITVSQILESELFENKNDLCSDEDVGPIIVYKEKSGKSSVLKSYVPEEMCTYER